MANIILEVTISDKMMKLGEDLISAIRGHAFQPTQGSPIPSEIRRPEIVSDTPADKIQEAKRATVEATASSVPSHDAGETSAPDTETKTYKLEDVRAKLGELSKAGKNIKGLIQSFGVRKLTDIPAEQYTAVMEKAGEL